MQWWCMFYEFQIHNNKISPAIPAEIIRDILWKSQPVCIWYSKAGSKIH